MGIVGLAYKGSDNAEAAGSQRWRHKRGGAAVPVKQVLKQRNADVRSVGSHDKIEGRDSWRDFLVKPDRLHTLFPELMYGNQ